MKFAVIFVCFSAINLQQFVSCTKNEDKLSISTVDLLKIIINEVEKLKTTRKAPDKLLTAVNDLRKIKNKTLSNEIFCQSCHLIMDQVIEYRKSGANKESMINYFKKLCYIFTDWGPTACDGYIQIEIDTALYIADNKRDLTGARVCAIQFQHRGCTDPQMSQWSVEIPPHSADKHQRQSKHHKHANAPPWSVLHLTDFHYDPLYQEGSNAECDTLLCCQSINGPPHKPENAAGYWGDYHVCDTPWHSITNFMEYVMSYHKSFDFVYYTGDIISHRSWATSRSDNEQVITDLYQLFKDTFKDTKLYPILGNHEPHPTDFYSPENVIDSKISTRWVFDLVANEWAKWLPESTLDTIRTGGYYTVLVRPGFRIIGLNSNVCFISNLWLIYDDEDPYDQLKWLVDILTEAERNGEKVHILSHIPPGDNQCLQNWASQFRRIVDRFAPIIAAQFNGHTHRDELRLFYDTNNKDQVTNAAFNAGSFTTFVGYNPNYRVYDVDQTNYTVLDYDHYTYNLTEANQNPGVTPEWYKIYSFKKAYGLHDTTYESLADLIERMSKDKTLLQQYYKYQVRNSDPNMAKGCNDICLNKLLCSITAVEATDSILCDQFVTHE